MTENKRFEYWKDSDTAYDTKIKYGQYFRIIDKKDMVHLLNEQEEQLKPFINLARDYNLTLNQLFNICSECIDKLDSIYEQKGYGDVE